MADIISCNSENIYEILQNEILNLTLKPGQSISENELCERFGVSRTPIRTTLARLQTEGLINVIPYKSSTVSLLSFDDIVQMIYLRVAVEIAVLHDFIDISTPMLEEKIRYIIRKQAVLIGGEFEPSDFFVLDSRLHEIWFKAVKREKLWEMIQRSQINYTRFRMLDITASQHFDEIIKEHENIFDLILKKDKEGIKLIIYNHLNGGISRLCEQTQTECSRYFENR